MPHRKHSAEFHRGLEKAHARGRPDRLTLIFSEMHLNEWQFHNRESHVWGRLSTTLAILMIPSQTRLP